MYRGLSIATFAVLALIAQTRQDRATGQQHPAAAHDPAVERFAGCLTAWKTGPDPRLKSQTTQALLGLAQGANTPSPELVRVFIDSLLAAVTGSRLTDPQAVRLALDLHEVLHCAFLTDERFEAVLKDASGQLRAAGVARDQADNIIGLLRKMGGEVRDRDRMIDIPPN